LQIFVPLFLVREQLLDALQALDGLGTHAVLHQDFRLQHQVLQGGGAERWFRTAALGLPVVLGEGRKPRRNHLETIVIDLSPQQLQPLLMTRLVGIDSCRAVQTFGSLGKVVCAAVQIEKLEQRRGVVVLAIGSVKQLAQKFQHLRRSAMAADNFLHQG